MTDLRDLLSRATPGPWRVETQTLDSLDYDTDEPQVYVVHPGTVCTDTVIATMGETASLTTSQKQANAALIVAAVNQLPNLLSELDGAREREREHDRRIRKLEAALRVSRGWVITCSESAQARRDLKTIDDALGLSARVLGEKKS